MPVEGPISRRVQRGVANDVEKRVTKSAIAGAKAIGSVLPDFDVDDEDVRRGVHDALADVWSGLGLDADVAAKDSAAVNALKGAAMTFVRPDMSASDRRATLAHAAGDPLTDAVLEVVVDLASLVPAGALEKGAQFVGTQIGDEDVRNRVETKWYAPFVPSAGDLTSVGGDLEKLRARMKQPGFRDELGRALDVVRVLGRLEAHNLEKIALDVDIAASQDVKTAFARFSSDVAEGIATSAIPRDKPESALVRDLVLLAAIRTRALGGISRTNDAGEFASILERLGRFGEKAADVVVDVVDGKRSPDALKADVLLDAAEALRENDAFAQQLPRLLDDAQTRLLDDLSKAGAISDEARAGIADMGADFSAVVVTATHLLRLFGAAKNDKIPEAERIDLVKNAAKDAGPIVVKLLQTFANQSKADGSGSQTGPIDGVTMRALVELQEHVPEMSDVEVRTQIEQGLGKKLEDAFVSFDMKPIASASIGQVHRAQIKTRFGGVRDVVVKVQRPGLDEEFARATRVARLGLQFAGELVKVLNDQGKMPKELAERNIDPSRLMKLVEETVASFVDSFQIETDFDKERVNSKKFRRDMRAHNHVTAPYVYRRWSSKTIMTMEYMRIEKISSLISRAQVARDTKKTQAPVGPLPQNASQAELEAEVKKRALDHIPRAFGIVVDEKSLTIERDKKLGFVVTATTDHPLYPRIRLAISDKDDRTSGVIKHLDTPPVLKDEDVRLVRDRFLASVLSQVLVHGRVHGDPHKGNWGLLADGQTIVMLDFGKMIDIKKKHLMAPIALAWNWYRKDANGMADAVLTMTTAPDGKKNAAKKEIAKALDELMTKTGGRAQPDDIVATVTATIAQAGLGLSTVYTQSIKAGFSFAGNFTGLSDVGAGDIGLSSVARAGRITALDVADSASLGVVGGVLSLRKNARVNALNRPPTS